MELNYTFVNREKELEELLQSFKNVIARKTLKAGYILQGREGIGKTKLVNEFINRIEGDVEIFSEIPKFSKGSNLINYTCIEGERQPYRPFIRIKQLIDENNKFKRILIKLFKVFMSIPIIGVNDLYNALADLGKDIAEEEDSVSIRKKEAKVFKSYVNFVAKNSQKVPLIIFIQKAQWIDPSSLKLIRKLLNSDKSLWGMIIMEIDDMEQERYIEEIHLEVNRLVADRVMDRIILSALDNRFPSRLLEREFGDDFLSSEENDILFAVSQGNPGRLISSIERYVDEKWIYKKGSKWIKKKNFKELIKPKFQQLVELICSTLEDDGKISEGESQIIRNTAASWDISDDILEHTIQMVTSIMDEGYNIIHSLGPGIVSSNSFLASDSENQRHIIEYLPNKLKIHKDKVRHRDIEHSNLLEAKDIRVTDEGILIIWPYVEAVRTRSVLIVANEIHIKNVLNKIIQITRALAELHRRGEVHGFIKPESIFKTKGNKYYLASFDISLINFLSIQNTYLNSDARHYLAPEQLDDKDITSQSDVFSLGVLFYKSLTDRFPFYGEMKGKHTKNIEKNVIPFDGNLTSMVPQEIQKIIKKCLQFIPEDRYNNAEEVLEEIIKLEITDEPPKDSIVVDKINDLLEEEKFEEARQLLPEILDTSTRERIKEKIDKGKKTKKTKPNWKFAYYIIASLGLIAIIYIFLRPPDLPIVGTEEIAIKVSRQGSDISYNPIATDVSEYLLIDDLSQSSSEKVLSFVEYETQHPDDTVDYRPKLTLIAKIANKKYNYNLSIKIVNIYNKVLVDTSFTFNNPSELLKSIVPLITKKTLKLINLTPENSTFTRSWDAFISFYAGEEYWSKLDITNALPKFLRALEIDSNFVLAKLRLADIYRFEGKTTKALKLLMDINSRLSELSKADSLISLALRYRLEGKLREAIEEYKEVLQHRPPDKITNYNIAESYFELRDIIEAVKYYRAALIFDNKFTPAINHLAYCYTHLGKHDRSLALFREYVKLDGTANSYDSMADGYMAAGILDSAIWAKRKGIEIDPSLGYLHSSLSYIYLRGRRLKEADSSTDTYLNIICSNTDTSKEQLASAYFLKALSNYYKGNYTDAMEYCQLSKSTFDSDNLIARLHELHWLLAILYLREDLDQEALFELDEMDRIINENRVNETNYNEVLKFKLFLEALTAAMDSDNNRVIELANKFDGQLKNKIKDHTSYFDLAFFNTCFGELFLQLGRDDLARARFEKALDYNENYAMAGYHMSVIYDDQGETQKADSIRTRFKDFWQIADIEPRMFFEL